MPTRPRRIGANRFALTVKLSINACSRSLVDAEIERLRHSVIPIIGPDSNRRPCLVGSAVVLMYRGRKVLVTAEHILSDNERVGLAFFGVDAYSRPIGGEFVISKAHDLAAKLLSQDEIDSLSHVPHIGEDRLGPAAAVGEQFYASVVGYPATAANRKDKITLDTPVEVYSNLAVEHRDGRVMVTFDKKGGAVGKSGHVTPRDPFGKSGGAIFGLPLLGQNAVQQQSGKLVGISTRWNRAEKCILGSGLAVMIPLLDQLCGR